MPIHCPNICQSSCLSYPLWKASGSRVNGLSGRADVQGWINLMPASCIQFHPEQNNDTLEGQVSSPDVWRRMETFLCGRSGRASLVASKEPDVALVHLFLVCIFSGCLSITNVVSLWDGKLLENGDHVCLQLCLTITERLSIRKLGTGHTLGGRSSQKWSFPDRWLEAGLSRGVLQDTQTPTFLPILLQEKHTPKGYPRLSQSEGRKTPEALSLRNGTWAPKSNRNARWGWEVTLFFDLKVGFHYWVFISFRSSACESLFLFMPLSVQYLTERGPAMKFVSNHVGGERRSTWRSRVSFTSSASFLS